METLENGPNSKVCPIHLIEKRYCANVDHADLDPCSERPENLLGQPIGQYHCPECGCMVVAGLGHLPHDHGCLLHLENEQFLDEIVAMGQTRREPPPK